jgi:uncharacterized cupredoxin-like copper-binding protein
MRSRILILLCCVAVALAFAGCSAAAASPRSMTIVMKDDMTFTPSSITVRQGETVAFDVRNQGGIAHEFFVGSAMAQADHETEMMQMSAMGHDHETGVHVDAGSSKRLAIKFSTPGTFLMGCHEPGHWDAGMLGTVVVQP